MENTLGKGIKIEEETAAEADFLCCTLNVWKAWYTQGHILPSDP